MLASYFPRVLTDGENFIILHIAPGLLCITVSISDLHESLWVDKYINLSECINGVTQNSSVLSYHYE